MARRVGFVFVEVNPTVCGFENGAEAKERRQDGKDRFERFHGDWILDLAGADGIIELPGSRALILEEDTVYAGKVEKVSCREGQFAGFLIDGKYGTGATTLTEHPFSLAK